jgi:formate-dependent nitrite reductase membrane component NrfD
VTSGHNRADSTEPAYRSYYGKPIIKPPVWIPTIPVYFFVGGTAGAAASLALAARLSGNDSLARTAKYVDTAAIGLSPALLIADLGRPERFLNMFRVFKPTSPMSVGTWIVGVSGLASGLSATLEVLGRCRRTKLAAEATAAALGPFLSTYTAALLADTAVPVWHEARRELPFVFAGSSAASAGAACVLIAPPEHARPARRLAVAGAALELAAGRVMARRLDLLAEPYRREGAGALATAAKALNATGMVTMLVRGCGRRGAITASVLLLAGSLCERFAVFHAGVASAKDPRYTIVPQRQRLKERSSSSERNVWRSTTRPDTRQSR